MNKGINVAHRYQAREAQDFLHEVFRMGKPEVIQADSEGAWFMFGDSPQLYKLPFAKIGKLDVDLKALKV